MADWSPPRPDRAIPPWRDVSPAALLPLRDGVGQHRGPSAFDPAPAPPRRRRVPFWRRSPRRAIAASFVALAMSTVVVTIIGSALTPDYGALSPYRETGVVDVREAPRPSGWTTDLARSILPGVPVRCVSFTSSESSGSLVVLGGATLPLGSSAACSSLSSNQVAATVALFDAASGRVLWTKDLRTVFTASPGTLSVDQMTIVPDGGQVLVQATIGSRYSIATLSLATGDETSSVDLQSGAVGQTPEVEGTLVLYAGTTSREGSTVWTLADVRHLDQSKWTAILPDTTSPVLTRKAAFTSIDGRSVRIDGRTGTITRFGDGSIDLSSSLWDRDGLATSRVVSSGTIVTAWDADGRKLWSRSGIGDPSGISRDCIVAALPGTTRLTCLDRGDGDRRWTTDVGSLAYAFSLDGQTTNDVPVYRSRLNRIEVVMLDGETGATEYVLRVDPQTQIIAVSRTTGYLRTSSQTGTATGITAFDMTSGRTLWKRTTVTDGETEFWGGHLVSVSRDQVARELGGRPATVLRD